jgi:hypothetical protein
MCGEWTGKTQNYSAVRVQFIGTGVIRSRAFFPSQNSSWSRSFNEELHFASGLRSIYRSRPHAQSFLYSFPVTDTDRPGIRPGDGHPGIAEWWHEFLDSQ